MQSFPITPNKKKIPFFVIAALVSVSILLLDTTTVSGPLRVVRTGGVALSNSLEDNASYIFSSSSEKQNQQQRIEELENELSRYETQSNLIKSKDEEINRLQMLLGLQTSTDIANVGARATSFGRANFEVSLMIDRGLSSGVAVGNPVLGPAGLLGRVKEVSENTAKVSLLADPNSKVGVRFPDGRLGLISGKGLTGTQQSANVEVGLIDPGAKVTEGDLLVTSGVRGSLYPPGIPVARINEIVDSQNGTTSSARASLTEEPSAVSDVLVLLWNG